MNCICEDNRFEIIERYKNKLISATNIESSPEEMAVLDNILFRFWQMGWLKEQEAVEPILIREGRNKYYNDYVCPRCDNVVVYEQNYCSECGVRFLWEGQ